MREGGEVGVGTAGRPVSRAAAGGRSSDVRVAMKSNGRVKEATVRWSGRGNRLRFATVAGIGAAALALGIIKPAFAYESDTGLVQSSSGIIALSCEAPNAAGAETSPSASSGGVTVPTVSTPPIPVPPVTIGQVQVGPEVVGPFQVGGFTVPPVTVGGETIGGGSQPDQLAGAGGVACAAVNVSNPNIPTALAGTVYIELLLQEINPTTNQVSFVDFWDSPSHGLVATPAPAGLTLATGVVDATVSGVPTAGQRDPATNNISLGLAEFYIGAQVSVNGIAESNGSVCHPSDFTCSTSETFAVL